MPCYHPLKAFVLGEDNRGKKKLKITAYDVIRLEECRGVMYAVKDKDAMIQNGSSAFSDNIIKVYDQFIEIPCGKCWGCRLNYSRTWANRLMMELEDHQEAWFLTLTYDNEHVPMSAYPDPETGEAQDCMTLSKRDWQLFMKRLRKEYDSNKLRFFASGEYGSKSGRPHYHAIIYGLHFEDGELRLYKRSRGFSYYNSDRLNKVWQNGFVVVAQVNWDTCAYTARYVMKKANGDMAKFYTDFNIEPEFCLMSRKPGIAKNYFDLHGKDIYKYDRINLSTGSKGINCRPPSYFDHLFEQIDAERLGVIKEQRQIAAERAKALEMASTDLDYIDYLVVKEHEAIQRQKVLLKRSAVDEKA